MRMAGEGKRGRGTGTSSQKRIVKLDNSHCLEIQREMPEETAQGVEDNCLWEGDRIWENTGLHYKLFRTIGLLNYVHVFLNKS